MDVVIDTDPGLGTLGADPEDALAIALALASPELTVRAVTCVHGNVPLRHGFANARRLLALLEREDVVVAAGAEAPLDPGYEPQRRWLAERDGSERVFPPFAGPFPTPRAVEVLLDARTVIAIGPLTNVAAALQADPSWPERLDRVVIMGGAFTVPGNVTPTAEFNFFADPEAARIVLDAGVQPVLVGLDVCHRTRLPQGARPRDELGAWFERAAPAWLASDRPYLYDSLAVAATIEPELLTVERAHVRIDPDGASVVSATGEANALVATGVDVDAFDTLLMASLLRA